MLHCTALFSGKKMLTIITAVHTTVLYSTKQQDSRILVKSVFKTGLQWKSVYFEGIQQSFLLGLPSSLLLTHSTLQGHFWAEDKFFKLLISLKLLMYFFYFKGLLWLFLCRTWCEFNEAIRHLGLKNCKKTWQFFNLSYMPKIYFAVRMEWVKS